MSEGCSYIRRESTGPILDAYRFAKDGSLMSDKDSKTETKTTRETPESVISNAQKTVESASPFVSADDVTYAPKRKAAANELDMNSALDGYVEILKALAPLKKKQENLKQVIKALLKEEGGKYTSPKGVRAQFVSKQASKVNKALAKEICGPRWAEVETFETEISLRVDAPGVKGD